MDELKIKCTQCQQNIAFPVNMHGQIIPCPHCGLSVCLQVPGVSQSVSRPPPVPEQPVQGKLVASNDGTGSGCFIQGLGFLFLISGLFTFGIGALIGIGLLIWGGKMARKVACSNCGNLVRSAEARMCPTCHCHFN